MENLSRKSTQWKFLDNTTHRTLLLFGVHGITDLLSLLYRPSILGTS